MNSIKLLKTLLLATGLISISTHGFCQTKTPQKKQPSAVNPPITISSDSFWADNLKGQAIYSGNVVADQGNRHLNAKKLTVERNQKTGQITQIIAQGNPAQFRYRPNKTQAQQSKELIKASANTIVVYPQRHLLHLKGNAKFAQGENAFSAPVISYNTKTQVVNTPKEPNGRTHMVIVPQHITQKASS